MSNNPCPLCGGELTQGISSIETAQSTLAFHYVICENIVDLHGFEQECEFWHVSGSADAMFVELNLKRGMTVRRDHQLVLPLRMPQSESNQTVWPLVIGDMVDRMEYGRQKYGVDLKPFDGRDTLVDAYQEALDLAVYLRKEIFERDNKIKEIS